MKWNHIEPEKTIFQSNDKVVLEKFLLASKIANQRLKSKKEVIIVIYFPVQLVIWSISNLKIMGVDAAGFIMIFFTIAFAILLDAINKLIFHTEINIECTEKRLNYLYEND